MSLLRIILWSLLIYLFYNTAKNVFRYLTSSQPKKNSNEIKQQKKTKYKIEREDVIDAHFEEIDPTKSDKQKENS
jgi:hypothetical protein